MKRFLSLALVLTISSSSVFASSTTLKQVDVIQNSAGGSALSVPSTGSSLVSDSATQTLTNKTISGASNTLSAIPVSAIGNGSVLVGSNTGDVTLGTTNGLSLSGQQISLGTSSTSSTGALTSTDWNTFNGKFSTPTGTSAQYVTGTGALSTFNTSVDSRLASLYGISSGIAQLDASGKIQVANLPSVVMQYQGAWTPSTNTPTLSDAGCTTSTNGNVYYVSAAFASTVAGLTDATMTGFQKGNLIICSSSISKWQQVAPASGVQSVNGAQGAVVLTQGNLTAAGVDGIAVTGGTNAVWGTGTSVAQQAATTSTNGYLKSVDWNTFNGKQAALTFSGALQNSSNTVTALFDNATIGVNGSNQLFVKNSGIGTAQITSGASANGTVLTANGSGGVSFASVPTSAPTVSGTFASPNLITAAVGVPFSSSAAVAVVYVAGNAGAVTVTAATQIAAGSVNGQHLTVMGTSATNTVKLSDGNGLFLNGPWTGGASSALSLVWDSGSSLWREISRSN